MHIDSGALDGITRKSVENGRKSVDIKLQIDLFMNCEVDLWESLFQIQEQLITSGSNGEPNWSYIPSKGKSTKTQTEFVSEIKKLAQKAANATDKTEQDSISRQAVAEVAKAADSTWRAGKPIPAGALDGITRESVESGRKSVDIKVQIDLFMSYEVKLLCLSQTYTYENIFE